MRPIYSDKSVFRRDERGAAIAELALMLPVLAIFILGSTDLGLIVREHQLLQNSAREAARFSAQPANKIDATNPLATANSVRDKVINYLAQEGITIPTTNCTADATVPKQWNCGDITIRQQYPITTVVGGVTFTDYGSEITVTYPRSFMFKGGSLFQFNSVNLNGRSVFRNLY